MRFLSDDHAYVDLIEMPPPTRHPIGGLSQNRLEWILPLRSNQPAAIPRGRLLRAMVL